MQIPPQVQRLSLWACADTGQGFGKLLWKTQMGPVTSGVTVVTGLFRILLKILLLLLLRRPFSVEKPDYLQ